jgi:DNA polymerase III delta prime subunit
MKLDLEKMQKDLEQIEISEIPLSDIFKRKKEEIFNKINLLKALRDLDSKNITVYSSKVYGEVDEFNLDYCKNIISNKEKIKDEEEFLTISEIKDFVNKFNHIYDINITLRESNKSARFVMK